jgi:hypothetical protein
VKTSDLLTYDCTSGSHCVVKVGHSRAVLRSRSYRKGEFFFQVLYLDVSVKKFSEDRQSELFIDYFLLQLLIFLRLLHSSFPLH